MQPGLQVTIPKLKKVVASTKAFAGKGPDSIDKHMAQRLPEKGWIALCAVMQTIITLGIVPVQFLYAWIALIPKPQGGLRPIALLSMCYRWLLKMFRPEMAIWDQQEAPPWDFSAPGRGADQAVFEEELASELDTLSGHHLAGALMDIT